MSKEDSSSMPEDVKAPSRKLFNPFKRAMKTASKGQERITSMFSRVFSKGRSIVRRSSILSAQGEDYEEDDHQASPSELDILRTFSPLMVHRHVYTSKANRRLKPSSTIHFGAVLFADISGFTRLANLLSVEQLQIHISNYFTMMFECVEQFGGDILKICGDAIMIMWPLENDAGGSSEEEMAACALTACLCGRELLLSCGAYHTHHGETEVTLSLHCGVGVADIPCYWVGQSSRWEFLITGDVLLQISSTEPEAKSGEIIVSAATYDLVREHLAATETPRGNYLLTSQIKVARLEHPTLKNSPNRSSSKTLDFIEGLSDHPTLHFDKNRGMATKFLGQYDKSDPRSLDLISGHARMGRGLNYYVHSSARPRLQQIDHSMEFEMAELRDVVTLFVNIIGLDEDFRLQRLEVVQRVMSSIVESHDSFGGTLRQFVVDDKGCVAIGALGVPHFTFEDNCVRAVNIANMLRSKIQSLGKNCSIGVSAGSVFCGLVGSSNRREYAMMGSSVNLAARLMCHCPIGGIIVDERVRAAACELLIFEDKGTIIAKGYADPVPIFAYQQSLRDAIGPETSSESFGDKLVIGRKGQLDSLRSFLNDYADGTPGSEHQFHLLEGEEGIGKSLIARQVAREAIEKGVHVVVATGSESNFGNPYRLLANMLDQFISGHERRERVLKEQLAKSNESPADSDSDDGSSPPPLLFLQAAWKEKKAAFNAYDQPLEFPSAKNKTERFREWVKDLLLSNLARDMAGVVAVEGEGEGEGEGDTAGKGEGNDQVESARKDLEVIHGYPVLDLVHLVGEVFCDADYDALMATECLKVNRRMQDHLLKTLLIRTLKAACERHQTVIVVDNLQWSDEQSALALHEFILSSDKGFGIFCYRSTAGSREVENHVFASLRNVCYRIDLPPLKVTEVAELAFHVIGSSHRSILTKVKLSRILTRTQGVPGLVESLVSALRDELERGSNPNIDDIRIPGQQSILQKFDALDVNLQLLLKTAAAIGIIFSVAALRKIYDTLAFNALLAQTPVEQRRSTSFDKSNPDSGNGSVSSISTPRQRSGTINRFSPPSPKRSESLSLSSHSTITNRRSSSNSPHTSVSAGPDLSPMSFSRSPNGSQKSLPRLSSTYEMFQRNCIESDIDKLVALGMFSPHDFVSVKVLKKSNGDQKEIPKGDVDTPEIGLHASAWHDARGLRRRGWAAISSTREVEPDKSLSTSSALTQDAHDEDEISADSTATLTEIFQTASPQTSKYYKFSHPSIQSTAYSLSLLLDRVPVHSAVIEYLTSSFNLSPGVEEACQYHSTHLHNGDEILFWLMKCTVSAHKTMRYGLFIQRAVQLLSAIAKVEPTAGEPEDQIFRILGTYIERQGVLQEGVLPSVYPYTFDDRVAPQWGGSDGKRSRNNSWLFSIGCIMRDVVCAMVSTGDFRIVLSLHILSDRILCGLINRSKWQPQTQTKIDSRKRATGNNSISVATTAMTRPISLPLKALEIDSDSDTYSDADDEMKSIAIPEDEEKESVLSLLAMDSPRYDMVSGAEDGRNIVSPGRRNNITSFTYDPPVRAEIDLMNYAQLLFEVGTSAEYVIAVHVMAYVRGQEALAVWNVMRGNSHLALSFILDAISAVQKSESDCAILYAILYPRLLALKSLCYPLSASSTASTEAAECLKDAQLWLLKAKERDVSDGVKHFYESVRPRLEGLHALHSHDSGEWVVLTVEAMGLCGMGEWTLAAECFIATENELKEVNDKVTLFHVKVLQAWALFLSGDLSTFHSAMHSVTSHTRQTDARLVGGSAGSLLAIRLSLSCFYDTADAVISNLIHPGTPTVSPISSPKPPLGPSTSMRSPARSSSAVSANMSGPNEWGANIFVRIAAAFLESRRNPKDVPLIDITILCAKISIRTPCTYLGGVYLFFTALTAFSVFDGATDSTSGGDTSPAPSSVAEPEAAESSEKSGELMSLLEAIQTVVLALNLLATRHTVLLYMSRAVNVHYLRLMGRLDEALVGASFDAPSLASPAAADGLPLGVAYLKMERALCLAASHDSLSLCPSRESLTSTVSVATESLGLFELYEADIEITVLKRCISDAEELLRSLTP